MREQIITRGDLVKLKQDLFSKMRDEDRHKHLTDEQIKTTVNTYFNAQIRNEELTVKP